MKLLISFLFPFILSGNVISSQAGDWVNTLYPGPNLQSVMVNAPGAYPGSEWISPPVHTDQGTTVTFFKYFVLTSPFEWTGNLEVKSNGIRNTTVNGKIYDDSSHIALDNLYVGGNSFIFTIYQPDCSPVMLDYKAVITPSNPVPEPLTFFMVGLVLVMLGGSKCWLKN